MVTWLHLVLYQVTRPHPLCNKSFVTPPPTAIYTMLITYLALSDVTVTSAPYQLLLYCKQQQCRSWLNNRTNYHVVKGH